MRANFQKSPMNLQCDMSYLNVLGIPVLVAVKEGGCVGVDVGAGADEEEDDEE